MANLELAARVAQIPKPATLVINARVRAMQAAGRDIINFSVGEPDFPTPQRICEAATLAMARGLTRYTEVQGVLPLREAVVRRIERDYGLIYAPDAVLVGNGGKQCLYNLFQALLNPGDEVIIPAPYWLTYPPQVRLAGGVPVIFQTRADEDFQIDPARLEAACTSRTRAILLNSPSNPTGVAYSREVLLAIADLVLRRDLVLISDDLYYQLVYGDARFESAVALRPELQERAVIVGGVSKAYAMTGWRIGYAVGPRPLISAMTSLQGQSTSNPSSVSQAAALEALTGDTGDAEVERMVAEFGRRRDRMMARLAEIPGVSCVEPQGAFYTFPDVSAFFERTTPEGRRIDGSIDLADYLVEAAGVAAVPGVEFGNDAHIRLSYACNMDLIDAGVDRMRRALGKLE